MALRDPATGLSCGETPFYPPRNLKPSDLAVCSSCTLNFVAPTAGPKGYTHRGTVADGLGVDESPLASITYNKTNYALYDTVIWRKGAHRDFLTDTPYDLEMNLYFRTVTDTSKQVAVAIPITINDTKSMSYFNELANQDPTKRGFSLETIIATNARVLMYKGMDLRGRNVTNPVGAPQCNDVNASLTWFVLGTAYISAADANRLRSTNFANNVEPPTPTLVPTLDRCRTMCMIVPKITVGVPTAAGKSKGDDIYLTRALQCQRIDPTTDVKEGAVYLKNQKNSNTLADELDASAALDKPLDAVVQGGVRPRDIEEILATAIAVALAVLGIVVVGYWALCRIYKDYVPTVIKEQTLIPAISDAKIKACKDLGDATLEAAKAVAAKLSP